MIKLRLIRTTPCSDEQMFTDGNMLVKTSTREEYLDFSFTLEDKTRDINKNGVFDGDEKKVYGKTAIPFGKYEGQVTYSNAFKRDMPLIKDVPEFQGIRIHGGNKIEDTYGCVLVAHNTDHKGKIWGSAERELTALIKANDTEGKFTIEII